MSITWAAVSARMMGLQILQAFVAPISTAIFDVNREYNYLMATEERGKINELDHGFRRSGDLFRLPQVIFSAFPIDLIALISFSPDIMSRLMSSFLLCVYA